MKYLQSLTSSFGPIILLGMYFAIYPIGGKRDSCSLSHIKHHPLVTLPVAMLVFSKASSLFFS
jgi:hypothetical protein